MFYVLAGLENMVFYVLAGLENMDVLCSGRSREHGCSMFWQV